MMAAFSHNCRAARLLKRTRAAYAGIMPMQRSFGILIAIATLPLSACTASSPVAKNPEVAAAPAPTRAASADRATRGLAFAQAHCASCHAVAINHYSPIPAAPAFPAVVNTPGLTPQTLETWLRDSHNYPDIMNFEIEPDHIADLAAYMMTLRESAPAQAESATP